MEQKENLITISGLITKILFQSNNGWGIALFKSDSTENSSTKIKGQIGQLEPRVSYELTGYYEENERYGKSFNVVSAKLSPTSTKTQAISYLSSPRFFSIGKVIAEKIANYYGDHTIEKIMKDYDSLYKVPDLPKAKADIIINALKEAANDNLFNNLFYENGLKIDFLNHLKEHTSDEDEIKMILNNDFYNYANQFHLQPFEEVDRVVLNFEKLNKDSSKRLAWFAHEAVNEILRTTGDTYTFLPQTIKKISSLTGIFDHDMIVKGLLKAKEMKILFLVDKRIYTDESWNDENTIASIVSEKVSQRASNIEDISKVDEYIDLIEKELANELQIPGFKYDESQKQALKSFANSNIFLLTGGPGTGKTITIKGMYKLYKMMNPLMSDNLIGIGAPTGRAAARINEIDENMHAITIHKMIGADEDGFYKFNEENPLEFDMIILDESSMIENFIFARFLQAAYKVQKIVLVGDQNQLPSVGYGELFVNLLQVEQISKCNLKRIHRQKDGNGIIDLSYMVLNNEIKTIEDINKLNHVNVEFDEEINKLELINNLFEKEIKQNKEKLVNLQIITPFYKGDYGINAINLKMQDTYQNKILMKTDTTLKEETLQRRNFKFIQDDKIMYLVNEADSSLMNGDVGIIKILKMNKNKVDTSIVDFNGIDKSFYGDNFNYSALSYACSVHKTQGSEYDDVIFVIEKGMHEYLLNKKIIYTALTRARNNLTLVGDFKTFLKGINKESIPRKTTLVEKIEHKLQQ